MRESSPDKTTPDKESCTAEIWANFQYEQLETLFRQVETAKKEWQLSLDSIRDMVILVELDGTIHRCNRAFREFLGLSYEEILRKDFASLLRKFGIEMNGLDLKALNARFHISGKWLGVRSYPYTDFETNDITRVVVIMLEVTANKGTEEKVRFVWGNNVYSRMDGGKASSSQPESEMGVVDALTPPETLTKALN
jgi:PAS domain-containing protein